MTLLVLSGLLSLSARAATLTVGPSGTYPTIQEAIDAAVDGDTIQVEAGDYPETISVSKDLALVGAGSGSTAIESAATVVSVSGAVASLTGFSIRASDGRGLKVLSSTLSLRDVVVSGASPLEDGAGLYASASTLDIEDCVFEDNDAGEDNGGHLYAYDSDLTLARSIFRAGAAEKGGALYTYGGTLVATDTEFSGNTVQYWGETSRGGALRAEGTTMVLTDCTFADNLADTGYGGHISTYEATLVINGGSFETGSAVGYYGGALALYISNTDLSDVRFTNNSATMLEDGTGYGYGGAIINIGEEAPSTLDITDCSFEGNSAEASGGAVRVSEGALTVTRSSFDGNSATRAGALYLSTSEAVAIRYSDFEANTADNAGAVYWRPDDSSSALSLEASTFTDNVASEYAGGLYAYSGGAVEMLHNAFSGNSGTLGGGAMLWLVGSIDARQNLFCANNASGETNSYGGGVFVYESGDTSHAWTNNTFVENSADVRGGGLTVYLSGDATITNNTFLGNAASNGGGLSVLSGGASLTNNLFAWQSDGDGAQADDSALTTLTYNDWFENTDDAVGDDLDPDALDATNLAVDPGLVAWSANGDCSDDLFLLEADSPLVDAGDPSITDIDDSRSDIGATGGPDADAGAYTDGDGDGYPAAGDCDDTNEEINPGADETPYDGIDDDCDGADLNDVDGDGVAGGAEGADCDDENNETYPGATEIWYDGTDGDCDGWDDYDQDRDGYASAGHGGDDCDDEQPTTHPGASDPAGDGIDSDCDDVDGSGGDSGGGGDDTDGATDDTGDIDGQGQGGDKESCGCANAPGGGGASAVWLALIAIGLARRRAG